MALIKCPECKKKISDQCTNCPQCGFPIKSVSQNENSSFEDNETTDAKKPFYKKIWVWIVVGVVLVALILGAILLLNRDTTPKIDKDGNPVFVELTNEVYTNAKNYKGYYINIKGKVFQVMSDNGNVKGIQIWIDPDTCEQNMMIYYNTNAEVKQGDYIVCSGYIDSVTEYKNAYDAKMYAPLVISSDLKKSTYMEVMAPAIETITPENLKQEKYGYSVLINKIEFAEKETRIYATATNNGKATLNFGDAVIVQDGKQYNSTTNYDADYEEIPYEIVKGVSSSGIIVFPAISTKDFSLTISIHSDDYDEELESFVFNVSRKSTPNEKPEDNKSEDNKPEDNRNTNKTSSNKNSSTQSTTNRYEEAIAAAIGVANDFFPTDRWFVESVLLNPSLEQTFEAFTDEETQYALQKADINWKKHAVEKLSAYADDEFISSQNDLVRNYLDNYGSFTDDEIEYAVSNCGIDWNAKAIDAMKSYWDNDYTVIITYYDFYDYLLELGFYDSTIEYALDNTSGYYRGEAVESEQERVKLLLSYGYTREAIIDWYSKDMDYSEAEALVDSCL